MEYWRRLESCLPRPSRSAKVPTLAQQKDCLAQRDKAVGSESEVIARQTSKHFLNMFKC